MSIWICKDRITTMITSKMPIWDKDRKVWELSSNDYFELPKNFIVGLKRGERRKIKTISFLDDRWSNII